MNVPQFWARGAQGDIYAWRWSSQSLAEAQRLANEAAQRLAERIRSGNQPPQRGGYYPNRPFREQIIQEIRSSTGETAAVVTRNSYGCLVLNTAQIMFVDIDFPEPKATLGFFRWILGTAKTSPSSDRQAASIATVENWVRTHPGWSFRVYRTRAGLRLLATQGRVDPATHAAKEVFEAFAADPLYQKLCETQKCFRARLTPKPWRCGIRAKPARWPWLVAKHEKAFNDWNARYQTASAKWATCNLVGTIGASTIDPAVRPIVSLHDEMTRATSNLDLA